jgi:glycosyltransferase involved in cell wall biosynthesis
VDVHILTPRLTSGCTDPLAHNIRHDSWLLKKLIMRFSSSRWETHSISSGLRRAIIQLHRQQNLQLVEMEESFGWARWLAGRIPVPIVLRLHGPWCLNGVANGVVQDSAFNQRAAIEKAGILAADAISAPSQDVIDRTRAFYQVPLGGATVIPNPVDVVPESKRWQLQSCEADRILFVGRFDRHKGGDTMIDAFKLVLSHRPAARLDFVGPDNGLIDDSGRNWTYKDYTQAKLTDSEQARVTFHGMQPSPVIAEFRRKAMVTVVASRYETFGIAAAEAMAAGSPIVSSDGGALKEVLTDHSTARVARAGDAADVSQKLLELLGDPAQAATLGRQAAVSATERFAPEVVAAQTAEFYRKVILRSAPHRRRRIRQNASAERQ